MSTHEPDLTPDEMRQLYMDIERSGYSRKVCTWSILKVFNSRNYPEEKKAKYTNKIDLAKRNKISWYVAQLRHHNVPLSNATKYEYEFDQKRNERTASGPFGSPMEIDGQFQCFSVIRHVFF